MRTRQSVTRATSNLITCTLGAMATQARAAVHEDVGTTGETLPNRGLITSGALLLGAAPRVSPNLMGLSALGTF